MRRTPAFHSLLETFDILSIIFQVIPNVFKSQKNLLPTPFKRFTVKRKALKAYWKPENNLNWFSCTITFNLQQFSEDIKTTDV